MGTRNLTAVYLDGEYRIAQYGQWDGYPSGQGATVIDFLNDKYKAATFAKKVRALVKADDDYVKNIYKGVCQNDGTKFQNEYPHLCRDMGAGILAYVQKKKAGLVVGDSLSFAGDGLFCEWAYVIDLDKQTLEVYKGFGEKPLTLGDRFYFLQKSGEKYPPVALLKSYSLKALPDRDTFIKELNALAGYGDE